ncbi:hypothetical protein D8674_020534 [Pyrus ussuriensis x Pyrus communis]|uniref:Uncharacterized protein n=1 Tax=Pyrus ussuriensis x Pyrus communis TaxID=2448454 RepID=A0A5N5HFY1_9ROSA|nr:hypothetical protein D8674_020534 [Pyrus ussuriensis x Pyrus communis]
MMGLERVFLTLTEELEESESFWKGKSRKMKNRGAERVPGLFFNWYKRYQYGGT